MKSCLLYVNVVNERILLIQHWEGDRILLLNNTGFTYYTTDNML